MNVFKAQTDGTSMGNMLSARLFLTVFVIFVSGMSYMQYADAQTSTTWHNTDFEYRVVIDTSASIPDTFTDFIYFVSLNNTDLNSNNIQSTGADIRFYDSTGTQLYHSLDTVTINATYGSIESWVKIPTLSNTEKTIYMYYGNSTATSTENSNQVWSDYTFVAHLNDNTILPDNYQANSTGLTFVDGKLGSAIKVDPAIGKMNTSFVNQNDTLTVSVWINIAEYNGTQRIIHVPYSQPNTSPWGAYMLETTNLQSVSMQLYTGTSNEVLNSDRIVTDTWTHIVFVKSSNAVELYNHGSLQSSDTTDATMYKPSEPLTLGGQYGDNENNFNNGLIDDVRITPLVRTSTWISTEYKNQNDSDSFYTTTYEDYTTFQSFEILYLGITEPSTSPLVAKIGDTVTIRLQIDKPITVFDWSIFDSDVTVITSHDNDTITGSIIVPNNNIAENLTFNVSVNTGLSNLIRVLTQSDLLNSSNVYVDAMPPVITLNGPNFLDVYQSTTFVDPGAVIDDGTLTISGTVDTANLGNYTIRYNGQDGAGNTAIEKTRTVRVNPAPVDPIIILNTTNTNPLYAKSGDVMTYVVKNLQGLVQINGTVNGQTATLTITNYVGIVQQTVLESFENGPAQFSFIFQNGTNPHVVVDSDNTHNQLINTYNITIDTIPPTISILGDLTERILQNSTYVDAGAELDSVGTLVVTNNVNTSILGSHIVSYDATDVAGNDAITQYRYINIVTADNLIDPNNIALPTLPQNTVIHTPTNDYTLKYEKVGGLQCSDSGGILASINTGPLRVGANHILDPLTCYRSYLIFDVTGAETADNINGVLYLRTNSIQTSKFDIFATRMLYADSDSAIRTPLDAYAAIQKVVYDGITTAGENGTIHSFTLGLGLKNDISIASETASKSNSINRTLLVIGLALSDESLTHGTEFWSADMAYVAGDAQLAPTLHLTYDNAPSTGIPTSADATSVDIDLGGPINITISPPANITDLPQNDDKKITLYAPIYFLILAIAFLFMFIKLDYAVAFKIVSVTLFMVLTFVSSVPHEVILVETNLFPDQTVQYEAAITTTYFINTGDDLYGIQKGHVETLKLVYLFLGIFSMILLYIDVTKYRFGAKGDNL